MSFLLICVEAITVNELFRMVNSLVCNYTLYYTLQSPSVFSLAKSLQLILGNSATYRLFTNLYLQIRE